MPRMGKTLKTFVFAMAWLFFVRASGGQTRGVENGQRYSRLVIRNVVVIDGKGTPPRGPSDIILENNKIETIVSSARQADAYQEEAHLLDGTGMYVLPGLINLHAHVTKVPALPSEYRYKLYLASGVTTQRDVGSDYAISMEDRRKSNEGLIEAPRIFIYMREQPAPGRTPEEARQRIREIKERGADGVKISGLRDGDVLYALMDEANKLGLRVAHDHKINETDAWDNAALGTTTIEHWYGVPDAALHGSQNFPTSYSYDNEYYRFAYAGRLWREADPES